MAYFASAGLVPRILQETTEKPAMLAMVAAGIGVALAPDWTETLSRAGVRASARSVTSGSSRSPLAQSSAWPGAASSATPRDVLIDALRRSASAFDPSICWRGRSAGLPIPGKAASRAGITNCLRRVNGG